MVKKIAIFIVLLSSLLVPVLIKRTTHSFHFERLMIKLPYERKWDCFLSPKVHSILTQDFHYLGRGAQTFVFESADRQYVLKFFIFDEQRFFSGTMPFVERERTKRRAERVLFATGLAMNYVPEETGLVYAHLNQTRDLLPHVHLLGPFGKNQEVNLDALRFVVQRRVEAMDEVLKASYQRGDKEHFFMLIDRLFCLLRHRASLGISNADPTLFGNFGFMNDQAIEFDFGGYHLCNLRNNVDQERAKYGKELLTWVRHHAPEWGEELAFRMGER